ALRLVRPRGAGAGVHVPAAGDLAAELAGRVVAPPAGGPVSAFDHRYIVPTRRITTPTGTVKQATFARPRIASRSERPRTPTAFLFNAFRLGGNAHSMRLPIISPGASALVAAPNTINAGTGRPSPSSG